MIENICKKHGYEYLGLEKDMHKFSSNGRVYEVSEEEHQYFQRDIVYDENGQHYEGNDDLEGLESMMRDMIIIAESK